MHERVDIRQLGVTAFESIPATIETIVKGHGRIDVPVNNAGFSMSGFAEDVSLDELRRQFDTNFFGVVAEQSGHFRHAAADVRTYHPGGLRAGREGNRPGAA